MNQTGVIANSSKSSTTNQTSWDVSVFGTVYIGGLKIAAAYNTIDGILRGDIQYTSPNNMVVFDMNVIYQNVNCSLLAQQQQAQPQALHGSGSLTLNVESSSLTLNALIMYGCFTLFFSFVDSLRIVTGNVTIRGVSMVIGVLLGLLMICHCLTFHLIFPQIRYISTFL